MVPGMATASLPVRRLEWPRADDRHDGGVPAHEWLVTNGLGGYASGTVVGAIILELVANIMVLSNLVSEFLVGAVQGAIIIIAMLVQRGLQRGR